MMTVAQMRAALGLSDEVPDAEVVALYAAEYDTDSVSHVLIDGRSYPVHADTEVADGYLAADVNATDWRAAEQPDKARALVTATRILNRQPWPAGVEDDPAFIAARIAATCELASQIVSGYDASNRQSTTDNVKRLKAGSVEQEFFRSDDLASLRLPLPVWELIGRWLTGGLPPGGALASGTCGESITERPSYYDSGFIGMGSIPTEAI